jgi:hypothetical protein
MEGTASRPCSTGSGVMYVITAARSKQKPKTRVTTTFCGCVHAGTGPRAYTSGRL